MGHFAKKCCWTAVLLAAGIHHAGAETYRVNWGGGVRDNPAVASAEELGIAYVEKVRYLIEEQMMGERDAFATDAVEISALLLPDGHLSSLRLMHGSGNPGYDAAVIAAISRTQPLPAPPMAIPGRIYHLTFTFERGEEPMCCLAPAEHDSR